MLDPTGWDVADDVSLVISELVTASVLAGAASISVQIEVHRTQLSLSISDDRDPAVWRELPQSPGSQRDELAMASSPLSSTAVEGSVLARGETNAGVAEPDPRRAIVAALTVNRGLAVGGNGRTTTWAQLACDPRATKRVPCHLE